MTLHECLAAAGMTPPPPRKMVEGRWLRFPGIGKGKSNRSGWCRIISPTLAIFGDWASGLSETWSDDTHRDDARTAKLLKEAKERERRFAAEQRQKQALVAKQAQEIVEKAIISGHPYLVRKGFANRSTLVRDGHLVIPVRDVDNYQQIISVQLIALDGEKRFLTGGRTRGGIHRLGATSAARIALCEGYATGLSIDAALQRLTGTHAVIVCFSARNVELVADRFPSAVVCADNDESLTGEHCAKRTGLRWIMPPDVATDFNDMHQLHGLRSVVDALRGVFA